jgi:magnesium chelatase family protein
MVAHYRQRISGPLLDRFDLQVSVPPVSGRDLSASEAGESSATVAARVACARALQRERFGSRWIGTNASMGPGLLRRHARPDPAGDRVLRLALRRLGLSARGHDGILRVARTIADLDAAGEIKAEHVAEAIQYRALERVPVADSADP